MNDATLADALGLDPKHHSDPACHCPPCELWQERMHGVRRGLHLAKQGIAHAFMTGSFGVYEDVRAAEVAATWWPSPNGGRS